jgi:ABC-type multidrug transport system fused ATPase/permease subunit
VSSRFQATASIDLETALRIQRVLRDEMSQSTVVTIAHRLEAVRDADSVVVLGDGRVLEQGRPSEVLGRLHDHVRVRGSGGGGADTHAHEE